jgi:hypothetical protein
MTGIPVARHRMQANNIGVSVPNAGLTVLLDIDVSLLSYVTAQIKVATFALAAFQVLGKMENAGDFVVLDSASAEFTTPAGIIIDASGDLTLQAVGSGWIIISVLGLQRLQLKATSSNVAGSTVSVYAGGV